MSNKLSTLSEISTNVVVTMDDVVNVFVNDYETQLIDKKNSLTSQIKDLSDQVKIIEASAISSADTSRFKTYDDILDVETSVASVRLVKMTSPKDSVDPYHLSVQVSFVDRQDTTYRRNSIGTVSRELAVEGPVLKQLVETNELYTKKSEELYETLQTISEIPRKERQIRSQISRKRISESGMSELLSDPEMLQLVQL